MPKNAGGRSQYRVALKRKGEREIELQPGQSFTMSGDDRLLRIRQTYTQQEANEVIERAKQLTAIAQGGDDGSNLSKEERKSLEKEKRMLQASIENDPLNSRERTQAERQLRAINRRLFGKDGADLQVLNQQMNRIAKQRKERLAETRGINKAKQGLGEFLQDSADSLKSVKAEILKLQKGEQTPVTRKLIRQKKSELARKTSNLIESIAKRKPYTVAELKERQAEIKAGNLKPEAHDVFFSKTGKTMTQAQSFLKGNKAFATRLGAQQRSVRNRINLTQTKLNAQKMGAADISNYSGEAKQVLTQLRGIRRQLGPSQGRNAQRAIRKLQNAWGDDVKLSTWKKAAASAGVSLNYTRSFGKTNSPNAWKSAVNYRLTNPTAALQKDLAGVSKLASKPAAYQQRLSAIATAAQRQLATIKQYEQGKHYIPGLSPSTLTAQRMRLKEIERNANAALTQSRRVSGNVGRAVSDRQVAKYFAPRGSARPKKGTRSMDSSSPRTDRGIGYEVDRRRKFQPGSSDVDWRMRIAGSRTGEATPIRTTATKGSVYRSQISLKALRALARRGGLND